MPTTEVAPCAGFPPLDPVIKNCPFAAALVPGTKPEPGALGSADDAAVRRRGGHVGGALFDPEIAVRCSASCSPTRASAACAPIGAGSRWC